MLNIIISGAPGCGKGTQSEMIVEKYDLKHFSTGDLLRNEIEAGTELGQIAKNYISKENLLPDEMIINIINKNIATESSIGKSKGIILDGFPRTVEQAIALEEIMTLNNQKIALLINLEVNEKELISRLLKRGEMSGRCDDNLETIEKRLEVYTAKTQPILDFYQSLDKLHSINGLGTIDEIFERITTVLDKYL